MVLLVSPLGEGVASAVVAIERLGRGVASGRRFILKCGVVRRWRSLIEDSNS